MRSAERILNRFYIVTVMVLNCNGQSMTKWHNKRRKCLAKGGEYDYAKTAAMFMDDFRNGRIGRISLEKPAEENE